ncbi:hypothetical protein COV58_00655 [Candidatus Roizmanbacteria bacterium CG11_big_fil_rev_8_21_14_0_20_36_8]|uniref:Cell division protein FtsL n=2 Tax=Candidatus Roizmaniibacteriota TaxID=1752723 RepID=A0A2M6IVD3_9BACT|nr:MAG: hypothetical protein COV58_00655 [Candidatus Roizmanbacteria bacterium CG11_big_fil_rev_8_21_14_0_20_36_8]PIZ65608.1 MAG: hypothetical protein COY14_01990 [Candidatus Roizmanbacteria bacterium CG_4_10_14_0_2_um_filter_36_9]
MKRFRLFILYGLLLFFVLSLSKNIVEYRRNLSFYEDYKKTYTTEKENNTKLKTKLVKSQDMREFEKNVRNKLGLNLEDETILVIPNPTPTVFQPSPTPIPNHKQWLDLLLNGVTN